MAPPTPFPPAAIVLAAVRETRFRDGIVCPRCGCDHIVRWGRFGARQRYRCRGCRRTFSDLTGTPAAYSKHLSRWPGFGACVDESLSVRRAAARLDVWPKTAFRWRHRLLDALRGEPRPPLRGTIGVSQSRLAFSEKGSRRLKRPPRRRGSRFRWPQPPPAFVVRTADRDGAVWAEVLVVPWPRSLDLVPLLRDRVARPAVVVGSSGSAGPYAAAARRLQLPYRPTRSLRGAEADPDVARVRAIDRSFLVWLWRFRGVASRYLPNYLIWHRVVDPGERRTPLAGLFGWDSDPHAGTHRGLDLGAAVSDTPHQHFPTTEPEGSRGCPPRPPRETASRPPPSAAPRGPPGASDGYARP